MAAHMLENGEAVGMCLLPHSAFEQHVYDKAPRSCFQTLAEHPEDRTSPQHGPARRTTSPSEKPGILQQG